MHLRVTHSSWISQFQLFFDGRWEFYFLICMNIGRSVQDSKIYNYISNLPDWQCCTFILNGFFLFILGRIWVTSKGDTFFLNQLVPIVIWWPLWVKFFCHFPKYPRSHRRKRDWPHYMAGSKLQAIWNHPAGPKTSLFPLFFLLIYWILCVIFCLFIFLDHSPSPSWCF